MRYTINLQHQPHTAHITALAGVVNFNGAILYPHEAAMLADALNECADAAETKASEAAAALRPVAA